MAKVKIEKAYAVEGDLVEVNGSDMDGIPMTHYLIAMQVEIVVDGLRYQHGRAGCIHHNLAKAREKVERLAARIHREGMVDMDDYCRPYQCLSFEEKSAENWRIEQADRMSGGGW
jgi:hypothetical protein